MTNHIFLERDGKVLHTAATKVLAQNESMRDIVGIMTEEMFRGATCASRRSPAVCCGYWMPSQTVDALQKYGPAKAPNESVGASASPNITTYQVYTL